MSTDDLPKGWTIHIREHNNSQRAILEHKGKEYGLIRESEMKEIGWRKDGEFYVNNDDLAIKQPEKDVFLVGSNPEGFIYYVDKDKNFSLARTFIKYKDEFYKILTDNDLNKLNIKIPKRENTLLAQKDNYLFFYDQIQKKMIEVQPSDINNMNNEITEFWRTLKKILKKNGYNQQTIENFKNIYDSRYNGQIQQNPIPEYHQYFVFTTINENIPPFFEFLNLYDFKENDIFDYLFYGLENYIKLLQTDWKTYRDQYLQPACLYYDLSSFKKIGNFIALLTQDKFKYINNQYLLYFLLYSPDLLPTINLSFMIYDNGYIRCMSRNYKNEYGTYKQRRWLILHRYNDCIKRQIKYRLLNTVWNEKKSINFNTWQIKQLILESGYIYLEECDESVFNNSSSPNGFIFFKPQPVEMCTFSTFEISMFLKKFDDLDFEKNEIQYKKYLDQMIENIRPLYEKSIKERYKIENNNKYFSFDEVYDIYSNKNKNLIFQEMDEKLVEDIKQKFPNLQVIKTNESVITITLQVEEEEKKEHIKKNFFKNLIEILWNTSLSISITNNDYTSGMTFFPSGKAVIYDTHGLQQENDFKIEIPDDFEKTPTTYQDGKETYTLTSEQRPSIIYTYNKIEEFNAEHIKLYHAKNCQISIYEILSC